MARSIDRSFYNSKAWKQCKHAYIVSKGGLCERCGSAGYVVHHRTKLTPSNINNVGITLNHANLELLCLDCHNKEHFGEANATVDGVAFDEHGDLVSPPIRERFRSHLENGRPAP